MGQSCRKTVFGLRTVATKQTYLPPTPTNTFILGLSLWGRFKPIGHCLKTNGQSHPGETFAPQEKGTAAGNQGLQDIQAGLMEPDKSAYGIRFSANDCFNGVRGPHHTIMAGSVGHGEDSARLPASKTLGEGLISSSSILLQIL
jgi:hypothetical protein